MVTDEMLAFIRAQHEQGIDVKEIERLLVTQGGWEKSDVEEALHSLKIPFPLPKPAAALPTVRVSTGQKTNTQPSSSRPLADQKAHQAVVRAPRSPNPESKKELSLGDLLKQVSARERGVPKITPTQEVTGATIDLDSSAGVMPGGIKLNLSALQSPPTTAPLSAATPPPLAKSGGQTAAESTNGPATVAPPPPSGVARPSVLLARRTMQADLESATGKESQREVAKEIPPPPSSKDEQPKPSSVPTPTPKAPVLAATPTARAESPKATTREIHHKNNIKRALALVVGVIFLLLAVAGALWAFVAFRGESEEAVLASGVNNFFGLSSFAYEGEGTVDFTLIAQDPAGGERNGVVKFKTGYQGNIEIGSEGYQNGNHRVSFEGGLASGDFTWSTDAETDLRVIDDALYFHIFSLPDVVVTKSLFDTFWVKIDLAELAKELALSGVVIADEEYGSFGGMQQEFIFNNILANHMPLLAQKQLSNELLGERPTKHITLKSDPVQLIEFIQVLYRKYTNRNFVISEEERVRLIGALEKIEGDIWIDTETGMPLEVRLHADFDDEVLGVRLKGPAAFTIRLSQFNQPVLVEVPTPMLTMEELKVRMAEEKLRIEARARDQEKLNDLEKLLEALESYRVSKKRYPTVLSELQTSKVLATSTISDVELKEFIYASYIKPGVLTKAGKCIAKGRTCDFYHVGIGLEDPTHPLLAEDADLLSDVRGDDSAGCVREEKLACYDMTSTKRAAATATPGAASSTPSN